MDILIFMLAPVYVLIIFTNNPIMAWVDKWACKEDGLWETKESKPRIFGYTSWWD